MDLFAGTGHFFKMNSTNEGVFLFCQCPVTACPRSSLMDRLEHFMRQPFGV